MSQGQRQESAVQAHQKVAVETGYRCLAAGSLLTISCEGNQYRPGGFRLGTQAPGQFLPIHFRQPDNEQANVWSDRARAFQRSLRFMLDEHFMT
jgi:hypothetical protein